MKKILFATTALVATAGIAAADVTISGSGGLYLAAEGGDKAAANATATADAAALTAAQTAETTAETNFTNTPNATTLAALQAAQAATAAAQTTATASAAAADIGEANMYGFMKIVATASGEADNGMTFGASIDATAGEKYDIGDFEDDGNQGGTFGLGSVYLATGGLKITVDQDGIDDLENDDNSHDVQIDYTAGDFSVSVTNDVDGDSATSYSYKLSYAAGGISASIKGSDADDVTQIDLGYDVTDSLNIGLHLDQNGGADKETRLKVKYTAGSVTIGAEYADMSASAADWDLSVGYSEGGMSLNASTNEEDEWKITGSYDLGGGLTAGAGIKHDDSYYLGVAMTF